MSPVAPRWRTRRAANWPQHRRTRRIRAAYRAVGPVLTPAMDTFERTLAHRAGRSFRDAVRSVPPGRILDLGTGTGRQLRLPAASDLIHAVGLDPIERLLHRLRCVLPQAAPVVGDALHLPFRRAAFDAAIAAWVWETLADPVAAGRELRTALCPGGLLLLLACTRPPGPTRLAARLLDLAFLGLFGTTVDEAALSERSGFTVIDHRRFNGGLFTVVLLRREPDDA